MHALLDHSLLLPAVTRLYVTLVALIGARLNYPHTSQLVRMTVTFIRVKWVKGKVQGRLVQGKGMS